MATAKEVAAQCIRQLNDIVLLARESLVAEYEDSSDSMQTNVELLAPRIIELRLEKQNPDSLPTLDSLIEELVGQIPDCECPQYLRDTLSSLRIAYWGVERILAFSTDSSAAEEGTTKKEQKVDAEKEGADGEPDTAEDEGGGQDEKEVEVECGEKEEEAEGSKKEGNPDTKRKKKS